jgi:hypothetical protein
VFLSTGSSGKTGDEVPLRHGAQMMQAEGLSRVARSGWNEMVADGGEYVDESLQACRRSKALHRCLSSSKGQMGVLRPVVEPLMRAMLDRRHDLSPGRGVRAQFVGDDALRRAALFLEQAPQQTSRRPGVATRLQNFVENVALLIDRSPHPVRLSADANDDLVEIQMSRWLGCLRLRRRTKSWPNFRVQRRTLS